MFKIPEHIKRIFSIPGDQWLPAERDEVLAFLLEDQQLEVIMRHILFMLYHSVGYKEAEEIWFEFCAGYEDAKTKKWIIPLDAVIAQYDPDLGEFPVFMRVQLRKFCRDRRRSLWRFLQRNGGLTVTIDGETYEITIRDDAPGADPQTAAANNQELAQLERCLNELEPTGREIIVRYYLLNHKLKDIAADLGLSEPNAKQLKRRALAKLRLCFDLDDLARRGRGEERNGGEQ